MSGSENLTGPKSTPTFMKTVVSQRGKHRSSKRPDPSKYVEQSTSTREYPESTPRTTEHQQNKSRSRPRNVTPVSTRDANVDYFKVIDKRTDSKISSPEWHTCDKNTSTIDSSSKLLISEGISISDSHNSSTHVTKQLQISSSKPPVGSLKPKMFETSNFKSSYTLSDSKNTRKNEIPGHLDPGPSVREEEAHVTTSYTSKTNLGITSSPKSAISYRGCPSTSTHTNLLETGTTTKHPSQKRVPTENMTKSNSVDNRCVSNSKNNSIENHKTQQSLFGEHLSNNTKYNESRRNDNNDDIFEESNVKDLIQSEILQQPDSVSKGQTHFRRRLNYNDGWFEEVNKQAVPQNTEQDNDIQIDDGTNFNIIPRPHEYSTIGTNTGKSPHRSLSSAINMRDSGVSSGRKSNLSRFATSETSTAGDSCIGRSETSEHARRFATAGDAQATKSQLSHSHDPKTRDALDRPSITDDEDVGILCDANDDSTRRDRSWERKNVGNQIAEEGNHQKKNCTSESKCHDDTSRKGTSIQPRRQGERRACMEKGDASEALEAYLDRESNPSSKRREPRKKEYLCHCSHSFVSSSTCFHPNIWKPQSEECGCFRNKSTTDKAQFNREGGNCACCECYGATGTIECPYKETDADFNCCRSGCHKYVDISVDVFSPCLRSFHPCKERMPLTRCFPNATEKTQNCFCKNTSHAKRILYDLPETSESDSEISESKKRIQKGVHETPVTREEPDNVPVVENVEERRGFSSVFSPSTEREDQARVQDTEETKLMKHKAVTSHYRQQHRPLNMDAVEDHGNEIQEVELQNHRPEIPERSQFKRLTSNDADTIKQSFTRFLPGEPSTSYATKPTSVTDSLREEEFFTSHTKYTSNANIPPEEPSATFYNKSTSTTDIPSGKPSVTLFNKSTPATNTQPGEPSSFSTKTSNITGTQLAEPSTSFFNNSVNITNFLPRNQSSPYSNTSRSTDYPPLEQSVSFLNKSKLTDSLRDPSVSHLHKTSPITGSGSVPGKLSTSKEETLQEIPFHTKTGYRESIKDEFTDKLPHSNEPIDLSSGKQTSSRHDFATNLSPSDLSSYKTSLQVLKTTGRDSVNASVAPHTESKLTKSGLDSKSQTSSHKGFISEKSGRSISTRESVYNAHVGAESAAADTTAGTEPTDQPDLIYAAHETSESYTYPVSPHFKYLDGPCEQDEIMEFPYSPNTDNRRQADITGISCGCKSPKRNASARTASVREIETRVADDPGHTSTERLDRYEQTIGEVTPNFTFTSISTANSTLGERIRSNNAKLFSLSHISLEGRNGRKDGKKIIEFDGIAVLSNKGQTSTPLSNTNTYRIGKDREFYQSVIEPSNESTVKEFVWPTSEQSEQRLSSEPHSRNRSKVSPDCRKIGEGRDTPRNKANKPGCSTSRSNRSTDETANDGGDERSENKEKLQTNSDVSKVLWAVTKINIYEDEIRTYEVMEPSEEPPSRIPETSDCLFILTPKRK